VPRESVAGRACLIDRLERRLERLDLGDSEIRIGQGITDVAEGDKPGNDDHGVGHAKTKERSRQPGAHWLAIESNPANRVRLVWLTLSR